MKRIKELKSKARLMWAILRSDSLAKVSIISPDDELRGEIRSSICEVMGHPITAGDEQFCMTLLDKIYSNIKLPKESRGEGMIEGISSLVFRNKLWDFCILSGLTSLWEFQVKLLANRLNVKTQKDQTEEGNINSESVIYKSLPEIMAEIKEVTNNCLQIDIDEDTELRNAVYHGRFHELRKKFSHVEKKIDENYKGNANVLGFSRRVESEGSNKATSNTIFEEQDVFSWLLDGTNAKLLKSISDHFERKTKQINNLIEFDAMSRHEMGHFFKKVVVNGERLSDKEMDLIKGWAKSSPFYGHLVMDDFMENIYECINEKK